MIDRNSRYSFRGKRLDDGKWIYGHFSLDEVCPETVGQSTGLRDKTGCLIYEDDIVRTHSGLTGVIKWGMFFDDEYMVTIYGWHWVGEDSEGREYCLHLTPEWRGHEVIGIIHDRT